MNTFPFPTRSQLSLNPAIITFVNFVASVLTLTWKQPLPLPPPLSNPNLTTVTLFNLFNYNLPKSQITRLQQIQTSLARAVVKAPKFCHITPILHSLHWLKITECIEHKILSLTYKVLTTAQPSYLHHLITIQPHRSTRSSSVVTHSCPPSSSSLRITDRSFRYAAPRLWSQLPASLWQPRAGPSISDSDLPTHTSSALSINSPLSSYITPSLFHSQLKTYLFHKSVPP